MILCLDFETTGIPNSCGIVEVGACWLTDHGQRQGEFFRECRPRGGCRIETEAFAVNGYTAERAFDPKRMTEEQAIVELVGFIRAGIVTPDIRVQIAAWNAPFEMRHLRAALERAKVADANRPFRHSAIDPQSILTADIIRGVIAPDVTAPGVKRREFGSSEWGGLVKNSDAAAALLGIPPEAKPHNGLNGARQVKAMLHALGLREPDLKTLHA